MGLLDKLRETITGDGKPKNFEVNFHEAKLGMTLSAGPGGEAIVTAGDRCTNLKAHYFKSKHATPRNGGVTSDTRVSRTVVSK